MNQNLYREIVQIMEKVQESTSIPQKCQYSLLNLFKQNVDHFYPCFEQILNMILLDGNKKDSIYVERVMNFCSAFCALTDLNDYCEQNSLELLYEKVLYFLLELHNLESGVIRFRVCKIISKLISLLDVELDADLFEHLKSNMLERLNDCKYDIRLQVINSIYRLQDTYDLKCKVILEFLKLMNGDLVPKVRKACVDKIALRRDTIDALLLRIRDVNEDVRLAAFTRMLNLAKNLRINEKQIIIKHGILIKCEAVNSFVKNQLLEAWLKEYEYKYLDFLKSLRLDANDADVEISVKIFEVVLDSLFKTQPAEDLLKVINLTSNFVIVYEELNWESSFYWRFLVNTCRKSERLEPFLENLLPDLVDLVKYILGYCAVKAGDGSSKEFQFILKQLFMMTCEYDLGDVSSRQALNHLINDVLCNYKLDDDVVEVIIKNMEKSVPKDENRERFLLEIISDISCPIADDQPVADVVGKIMELKLRVNSLRSSQDSAIREKNFSMADECQQEIDEIVMEINSLSQSSGDVKVPEAKTDSETLLKWLRIARGHLRSKKFTCISSSFKPLCEDIIQKLTNSDEKVCCKALECYVLCCIVDKEMASKGVCVFYASIIGIINSNNFDVDCLVVAIKGVVDMLMVYGQDNITRWCANIHEGSLFSFADIIQLLVNLMDDENLDVQECAGDGLCRIILNLRIFSPNLIARMILKWCNPGSDEGQFLRQTIGITLEQMPLIFNCGEQLDAAFFITVQTLLDAPNTSPLSQVDIQDIIKFMLNLCSLCQNNVALKHKYIAMKIVCQIKDNPEYPYNSDYAKILPLLDGSSWDQLTFEELETLCNAAIELTTSRIVLNCVTKFKAQWNKGREE